MLYKNSRFVIATIASALISGFVWAAQQPAADSNKKEEKDKPPSGVPLSYGESTGILQGRPKNEGEKGGYKFYYLTPAKYTFYYSGGLSAVFENETLWGGIVLLRFKRVTNFTFYDLQIQSYLVPGLTSSRDNAPTDVNNFTQVRFKKSAKFLDWPYIYEWSIYSGRYSSIEKVLRATLETGWGAFLWRSGKGDRKFQLNAEGGIAYDFANLDAYAANLSTGYLKVAVEWDWDYKPLSGKAVWYNYIEAINPDPKTFANQSRADIEGELRYQYTSTWSFAFGLLWTEYWAIQQKFLDTNEALVKRSVAGFLTATYKHKL